jgi:hypothetical protein
MLVAVVGLICVAGPRRSKADVSTDDSARCLFEISPPKFRNFSHLQKSITGEFTLRCERRPDQIDSDEQEEAFIPLRALH